MKTTAIETCRKLDDDYEVMGKWDSHNAFAEMMLAKQTEWHNWWCDEHNEPEGKMGREYYTAYSGTIIDTEDTMGTVIVHLDVGVADELCHMQLLGVFSHGKLIHLTHEIDTHWREVMYLKDNFEGKIDEQLVNP